MGSGYGMCLINSAGTSETQKLIRNRYFVLRLNC